MSVTKIKRLFTEWYINRGYLFGYVLHRIDFDEPNYPKPIAIFDCPWYVKPLLCFFSPSVYFREKHGKAMTLKSIESSSQQLEAVIFSYLLPNQKCWTFTSVMRIRGFPSAQIITNI